MNNISSQRKLMYAQLDPQNSNKQRKMQIMSQQRSTTEYFDRQQMMENDLKETMKNIVPQPPRRTFQMKERQTDPFNAERINEALRAPEFHSVGIQAQKRHMTMAPAGDVQPHLEEVDPKAHTFIPQRRKRIEDDMYERNRKLLASTNPIDTQPKMDIFNDPLSYQSKERQFPSASQSRPLNESPEWNDGIENTYEPKPVYVRQSMLEREINSRSKPHVVETPMEMNNLDEEHQPLSREKRQFGLQRSSSAIGRHSIPFVHDDEYSQQYLYPQMQTRKPLAPAGIRSSGIQNRIDSLAPVEQYPSYTPVDRSEMWYDSHETRPLMEDPNEYDFEPTSGYQEQLYHKRGYMEAQQRPTHQYGEEDEPDVPSYQPMSLQQRYVPSNVPRKQMYEEEPEEERIIMNDRIGFMDRVGDRSRGRDVSYTPVHNMNDFVSHETSIPIHFQKAKHPGSGRLKSILDEYHNQVPATYTQINSQSTSRNF
jgi:hypothetical protein